MEITGQDAELPEIRRRARFFAALVVLVFIVIAVRLFFLQVVEGDHYYRLTSENIVRTLTLPAVRGEIRDRKNRVLARMRPAANVSVMPRQVTSDAFERMRTALALAPEEAAELWDRVQAERKGEPRDHERAVAVREDIPREAQARLEETAIDLPGVRIDHVIRREYPSGPLGAHLLGYMNEISADELKARKDEGYRAGDLVGRTGIERQLEGYLRGRPGFEKVVAERRGVPKTNIHDLVEGPVRRDPVAGNHVVLTIDIDVQRIAERAMRNAIAGAVVVMDAGTGRLLALVSKPGFDPNEMSGRLTAEAQARILADRHRPLRDKAVSETYFPGSTFKVVSALAALEDRLVTPDERVKCHGSYEIGGRRFKCTKTHGVVGLYEAIVQSCNVYFYELGARPGTMDRLAKFATEMGLGAPAGLGLNGEEAGFIPTEEWYREQKRADPRREGFQVGHALNAVIGQGSTRVTLLQMTTLYAAVASGGKLWLPQIVERIESPSGQVMEEMAPRVRRELAISPDTMSEVRQALAGVVNHSKGTAFKARPSDAADAVEVAGKTGTAQVVRRSARRDDPVPLYEQNDHAWFVGFAPAGNPRIAFAVLVEHGGHGGEVAAPVALEIAAAYFDTVAPGEKAAPRVGLPRRRPLSSASGSASASVTPAPPAAAAATTTTAAAPEGGQP